MPFRLFFFQRNSGIFEFQAQIKISNIVINEKESDDFFSFINANIDLNFCDREAHIFDEVD